MAHSSLEFRFTTAMFQLSGLFRVFFYLLIKTIRVSIEKFTCIRAPFLSSSPKLIVSVNSPLCPIVRAYPAGELVWLFR